MSPLGAVEAVVFDVGETLIDETRLWSAWADRLGVTRLTFLGALGGMAAIGRSHRDAFTLVRPDIDLDDEIARWASDEPDALRNDFDADDLYPDVRPAFAALHDLGLDVIIAGNQPPAAGVMLRSMGLGVEQVLISEELGVQKPDPAFFAAVAEAAGRPAQMIAYVGDRVDNDVVPAAAAGMVAVLLRRGPWGYLQAEWPEASQGTLVVDGLAELVDALTDARR